MPTPPTEAREPTLVARADPPPGSRNSLAGLPSSSEKADIIFELCKGITLERIERFALSRGPEDIQRRRDGFKYLTAALIRKRAECIQDGAWPYRIDAAGADGKIVVYCEPCGSSKNTNSSSSSSGSSGSRSGGVGTSGDSIGSSSSGSSSSGGSSIDSSSSGSSSSGSSSSGSSSSDSSSSGSSSCDSNSSGSSSSSSSSSSDSSSSSSDNLTVHTSALHSPLSWLLGCDGAKYGET